MEEALKWLAAAGGGLGAALSIWNWFQSPAKKNADDLVKFKNEEFGDLKEAVGKLKGAVGEDIKLLDTAVDDTKARVASLEAIVRQLPDKDGFHRLELQLEKMNTKIAGMAASAEATQRTAGRVEQFLLDQGGKQSTK